jgi:hypothetical protein
LRIRQGYQRFKLVELGWLHGINIVPNETPERQINLPDAPVGCSPEKKFAPGFEIL